MHHWGNKTRLDKRKQKSSFRKGLRGKKEITRKISAAKGHFSVQRKGRKFCVERNCENVNIGGKRRQF